MRGRGSLLISSAWLLAAATPLLGQEGRPPLPELPETVTDDVFQLHTGEVVRGKFAYLRGGKLKIKSKKLGEQTVDWDDVRSLRLSGPHRYRLKSGGELQGNRAVLRAGELMITVDQAQVTVPKSEIKTINPRRELDHWQVKGTVAWAGSYGNTRRQTVTGITSVVRDDGTSRLALGYIGSYGRTEDDEDTKKHRGDAQFDYSLGERVYLTPFVGQVEYDKFSNIELRWRAGVGVGCLPFKDETIGTVRLEVGGSYTRTRLRRRRAGQDRESGGPVGRLAGRAELKLNKHIAFKAFAESYVGLDDVQNTTHHVEGTISFKYKVWSLDVGVIYDRTERPKRRSDGTIPKHDDAKLFAGLGLAF